MAQVPAARLSRTLRTLRRVEEQKRREIGTRIAQARKEAGMTQPELAEVLNVSHRSVQDYEAGKTVPYKYFPRLEEIFPGRGPGWWLHGRETTLNGELSRKVDEILAILKAEQNEPPPEGEG